MQQLSNSIVILIKPDGKQFENIRANVQPTKIFIHDPTLPIEEGDIISRNLPNGLVERYLVLDRGFFDTFHGIGAHYQVKVRKESSIQNTQNPPIVYNLHGSNPKVNINSQDSSINITHITNENGFEQLKKAIEENIAELKTREVYLKNLEDLQESVGSNSFLEKYQRFISTTADHISIIAPFIPFLTQLIKIP